MQNISSTQKTLTFLASKIFTPALFIKTILKAHQPNKDDTLTIIFRAEVPEIPKELCSPTTISLPMFGQPSKVRMSITQIAF